MPDACSKSALLASPVSAALISVESSVKVAVFQVEASASNTNILSAPTIVALSIELNVVAGSPLNQSKVLSPPLQAILIVSPSLVVVIYASPEILTGVSEDIVDPPAPASLSPLRENRLLPPLQATVTVPALFVVVRPYPPEISIVSLCFISVLTSLSAVINILLSPLTSNLSDPAPPLLVAISAIELSSPEAKSTTSSLVVGERVALVDPSWFMVRKLVNAFWLASPTSPKLSS